MMDDLISRQAAIDALHNYWRKRLDTLPTKKTEDGEVYADTKSVNKILEYNKALTNFIKALPSAQQWIPWVDNDDRLKNHYYYLVTHVGIEIPMLAQFHDDGCYFEIISMYPHKSIYVWDNDIITAWMPLPEIYKGEE